LRGDDRQKEKVMKSWFTRRLGREARVSFIQLGALVLSMQEFAAQLIATNNLDDATIAEARAATGVYLRNTNIGGAPFDEQADALGKAIKDLEQLLDDTVARARQLDHG
jgi:hypothetical protein